jgi:hypothetical protein
VERRALAARFARLGALHTFVDLQLSSRVMRRCVRPVAPPLEGTGLVSVPVVRKWTRFCTTTRPRLWLIVFRGRTDWEVTSRQDISRDAHNPPSSMRRAVLADSIPSAAHSSDHASASINLPKALPPSREELALWRAFLSDEIEAILRDE